MKKRAKTVDIYLIGRGIADGTAHMTVEAVEALRSCRVVFDLSADVKAVRRLHPNVVDLAAEYWTGELCDDVYPRLKERVLTEAATNGPTVGIIVDGHPMVFDDVNWGIYRTGRRRGLRVEALPGISCLDTLLIDTGVDLGDGTQIVHASRLVLYGVTLDSSLHTYLLEVDKFGTNFFSVDTRGNRRGRFTPLAKYLTRFYPADHMVTLLVSTGRGAQASKRVRLGCLDDAGAFLHRHENEGMTMHIPAIDRDIVDEKFSRQVDDKAHLARIAVLPEPKPRSPRTRG